MGNGIDRLLGGSHLLNGLGLDPFGMMQQLEEFQEIQLLHELRDSFQMTGGGLSPNALASLLQNGGIGSSLFMPPPNAGGCSCPHNYAPPQTFDFGASTQGGIAAMYQRAQGAMFERFLAANPFARQQLEMTMGGRIVPDGLADGRISVQQFGGGIFPSGGGSASSFQAAAAMFDQMARGQIQGVQGQQSPFQGMILQALANLFGGQGPIGAPGAGGGNNNNNINSNNGNFNATGTLNQAGDFQPGVAGPNQGAFGLGQNDGSDIAGVLNDPSLTVEDKVTLMIMLIMKKMDDDIEKQAQEINKLQQQQQKQGGGGGKGGKGGGGGGGGGDKSIDVETMKLKRLIDKRSQMFDMLRQIIDKYNQTAKGIIDSIGRG